MTSSVRTTITTSHSAEGKRRGPAATPGAVVNADPARDAEQRSEESRRQKGHGQAGGDLLWRGSERTGERGGVPCFERCRPGDEDGVDGGKDDEHD